IDPGSQGVIQAVDDFVWNFVRGAARKVRLYAAHQTSELHYDSAVILGSSRQDVIDRRDKVLGKVVQPAVEKCGIVEKAKALPDKAEINARP
ncbi:hypothetical protein, partial [Mesorhizobium sp. M1A.T.Ca.IN.004.03.1.1]|uniref:hypothetical protein n=1 Tax=Mesorhizobium sp. M1A.T.Ca.IN.004.03.1.1 TaxID=2496795 RepID=UPI0019D0BC76